MSPNSTDLNDGSDVPNGSVTLNQIVKMSSLMMVNAHYYKQTPLCVNHLMMYDLYVMYIYNLSSTIWLTLSV